MTRLFATGLELIEETRADNALVVRCSVPLADDHPDISDRLRHWAATAPDRALLSESCGKARRTLSYRSALERAIALQAVLSHKLGVRKGDRIVSLAPAGIDALVLKLASLVGGFVHVTLPPHPFSGGTVSNQARAFLNAVDARLIVAPHGHAAIEGAGACRLEEILSAETNESSRNTADAAIDPDDWAAIFFTSGSTGAPKGVPVTRAMISSNQAAIAAMWPFIARTPPVMVDWLPWHHVFGGLDNIFKVIWNGGTLHIDAAPSLETFDATVRLMEEVSPTLHIAVPLGLRLLLDRMEKDDRAALAFTRNLKAIFFAGAGIDSKLWQRLAAFQAAYGNFEVLSGYGATEAASTICLSPAPLEKPGELGHPLPGHRVALVEADGRMELCVSGPNVAPCYLIDGHHVPLPLDKYGFYRTGDAAMLQNREDGVPVLCFDGRLAEDFKLSSGVKVRSGTLRARLLSHCAPLADDVVIAGENRDSLVALIFAVSSHRDDPGLVRALATHFGRWNAKYPASSTRIARFAIAEASADRAHGELSDKGQIVQSRYIRNHAGLFEALQNGAGHSPATGT